jgi:hypothetical protein
MKTLLILSGHPCYSTYSADSKWRICPRRVPKLNKNSLVGKMSDWGPNDRGSIRGKGSEFSLHYL